MNRSDFFDALVRPEVQEFIRSYEQLDERRLVLDQKSMLGIPSSVLADQIAGSRKAREKLPEFYKRTGIVYPPSVNLEQCSSEHTARFKARLAAETHAKNALDLTGGFGVDAYYISKVTDHLDYNEPDSQLTALAAFNHHALGASAITHHSKTAQAFLKGSKQDFDLILVDPSRRDQSRKVFKLAECIPNVAEMIDELLDRATRVIIKTSPLLDLQQGWKELGSVEKIYVVASAHECKEVLFICSKNNKGEPPVHCVNLSASGDDEESFVFSFEQEREATSVFSDPLTYLYEPHPWILKGGAFKLAGQRFDLAKLQVNTHLYTSHDLCGDFPGRIFRIESLKPNTDIQKYFPSMKANVISRNYPQTPDQLKQKFKLEDGGERYLIAFSGVHEKFLVAASRIR